MEESPENRSQSEFLRPDLSEPGLSELDLSQPDLSQPDRRSHPRYPAAEEATLLVVNHGSTLPARIVEVSLGGCRLSMKTQFRAGTQVRVEVGFKINRIAFRLSGVTQWTDGHQTLGIRFGEMSSRRAADLAELLAELAADLAAKQAREAADHRVDEPVAPQSPPAEVPLASLSDVPPPKLESPTTETPVREKPGSPRPFLEPRPLRSVPAAIRGPLPTAIEVGPPAPLRKTPPVVPVEEASRSSEPTIPIPVPDLDRLSRRERRQQTRHCVDTTASIFFIDVAARARGRILDVSMSGCRIRTDERFPVGIYRRVETEFRIDGLPFRLAGVVQSLHDRFTVGIRFLNLSERKADQLQQLMEEIDEMRRQGTFDSQ